MNKQEVYDFLAQRGIWHEITEHNAVWNMGDLSSVPLPYPTADAKNLFVRDDKKRNYYLITVRGDKRVDLKEFAARHGTRKLSFASPADLAEKLDLIPGAVSPLGILNGKAEGVSFFLDADFLKEPGLAGMHPNDNTATVWLRAEDLIALVRETGVPVSVVEV